MTDDFVYYNRRFLKAGGCETRLNFTDKVLFSIKAVDAT